MHYVADYLRDPPHKISVSVIGTGGTGSQVLVTLARMNAALIALGRPGIRVEAWDPDEISETNIGRQHFSPKDIGKNKAEVLVTRINRYYGFDWTALPYKYTPCHDNQTNILITCVDNISSRREICEYEPVSHRQNPFRNMYYWLDFGNGKDFGQAVLGCFNQVKQPKSKYRTVSKLEGPNELFNGYKNIEEDINEPSCSMQEALLNQDLLINSTIVMTGMNMLWNLLKDFRIFHNQVFVNTATMQVQSNKL